MRKTVLFISILFLVSCNKSKTDVYESVISEADRLMDENQDSAVVSLSMLDDIRTFIPNLSKKDRMRFYLTEAKAMNKAYVDFTSDSKMQEAVEYYMNHGTNKEKLMSNYLLGCVYRDLNDSPRALPYLLKATEYADNDKESYLMLMRIHNQIAELYMKQALIEQAVKEYDNVFHYSCLAGDTIDAILSINQKASAYALINQVDSAVTLKNKAIDMFKDLGYIQYAAQISGSCMELLLNSGMYEKAKENSDFYDRYSGYYRNGEVKKGHETYYYGKGLVFLHSNQFDSARIMFEKCGRYPDDSNLKIMHYRGLSLLYDKIQQPDSTANYAMLAYAANDSAYQIKTAMTMLNLESVYDYGKFQEEAKTSAERLVIFQRWLFGLIVIVIVTGALVLYVFRTANKRNRKKISVLHERYETEKKLLQKEMEELNALLEEKEYLLDNKTNIVFQKNSEMNKEIEIKEQSIFELQERVNEYEKVLKIKDSARLEEEIQSSAIKKDFAYYTIHVTEHPKESKWNELINFAESYLPQLYMLLHNYNVSQKEMRLCILVRLRFKPGEIATIMNCRFPEVSLIRSRLLKKIYGIDNGKAIDFDKRIMLLQ